MWSLNTTVWLTLMHPFDLNVLFTGVVMQLLFAKEMKYFLIASSWEKF